MRVARVCVVAVVVVAGFGSRAWAQNGAIAGTVNDSTGGVLPGVTVEAASPALIEKTRVGVSDGQGLYKIVDLRPGTYTVTLTLPGFKTLKREGIELPAGFTATVNAQMGVGEVSETLTVTGQSPLVDVQNATQQRVLSSAVLEALPTGRNIQNVAVLIPGVNGQGVGVLGATQDVGGNTANRVGQTVTIHGSRSADMPMLFDRMQAHNMTGRPGGVNGSFPFNPGNIGELAVEIGGMGTEALVGGVTMNIVPREGGNSFSGMMVGNFTNASLQSSNIDSDLQARGLRTQASTDQMWDLNPSVGGPVMRDRLWFYGSFRRNRSVNNAPGAYYAKDPHAFIYVPDLNRPAIDEVWTRNASARLTMQLSPRNKLAFYYDNADQCSCQLFVSATRTPEASGLFTNWGGIGKNQLIIATWNSPITNRLLIDAAVAYHVENHGIAIQPEQENDSDIAVTDVSTGINSRAATTGFRSHDHQYNMRASAHYVTGSHAVKVGMTFLQGARDPNYMYANGSWNFTALRGEPSAVTVYTLPYTQVHRVKYEAAVFAEDQWKVGRLTVTPGVRFDLVNAYVPANRLPATRFVGPRDFAEVPNVPNWRDVSPRLSAAYDLFGNGKTAVKASVNRYLIGMTTAIAAQNDPVVTSVNSTTRGWTDFNHDFVPQDGELGPLANQNFGKLNIVNHYDPDILNGWGKRPYDWEAAVGLQHELAPGVSVAATYNRHWYKNKYVIDNTRVTPDDYDQFCITAPVDSRLPTSGQRLCGFYDVTPSKFGQVDNFITFAKSYGNQQEVYDGVDTNVSVRLPRGVLLQGGTSTGRVRFNDCFVVDSPGFFNPEPSLFSGLGNRLRDCAINPPFLTQVKLLGVYPLPWGGSVSVTYQSIPGPQITASYAVPTDQVAASLGRPLAGGVGSVNLPLVAPGTMYGDRLNQFDVRFAKKFRIGRSSLQPQFDLYNISNANPVLGQNNTYGPAWQVPLSVLGGRLFKVGAQWSF